MGQQCEELKNIPRDGTILSFSSLAWSQTQNSNGQEAQLAEFEFYQKEAHAVLAVMMSWDNLKLIFIVLALQNGFLIGNLPQLAKTVQ